MRFLPICTKGALLLAVLLLSACATPDYVSEMYGPHFGRQVFPHFDASVDPDPAAIVNGLYTPRPLQNNCYLCSPQYQSNWSGWSP